MSSMVKRHGMMPGALALVEDGIPDRAGILAAAENLIAALAGIAGARDHHRQAEQPGLHVMEIGEVANAGHMLCQIVDGHRPLQRKVVQIVVEAQRDVAAHGGALQLLMAGARTMHDHPGIRAGAVEDAVVGEIAGSFSMQA